MKVREMSFRYALSVCTQSILLLVFIIRPIYAADPVRMGCGVMTFDTVPGWGLDAEGHSQIGPTHGNVVVDLGRAEALLKREELLNRETFRRSELTSWITSRELELLSGR